MKKAGIYDPYLDTLGGGERYTMTVADCLAKKGWQVDVFWDDKRIKKEIKRILGINLSKIQFVEDIFSSEKNLSRPTKSWGQDLLKKLQISRKYDLIFYLSDGSVPFLFAKKNLLHFQVPFHGGGGRKPLNQIKLKKIDEVVCNSRFTKKFIDKEYGVKSKVIYPPVAVDEFKPEKKENIILCVGRFTDLLHNKRQDILIDVFRRIYKTNLKGWKLVLAGGDKEGKKFVARLKKMARDYPIEIITNPHFNKLKCLYGQAKIFWTAAGFGVDEEREPEKTEHFGITTVEAMAAGCVPVVIDKGGQKEIVADNQNGLLWKSKKELITKSLRLIEDLKLWQKLSKVAQKRAQDFSLKRFCHEIQKIVG